MRCPCHSGDGRQEGQQPERGEPECSTTTGLWNQGSGKRRREDCDSQVEALEGVASGAQGLARGISHPASQSTENRHCPVHNLCSCAQ